VTPAPKRPARVPDHPSLLARTAHDIGGKTVTFHFTGTREEAQAILDEIDRQANEIEAKTEKK
jgi:hypothetical protein